MKIAVCIVLRLVFICLMSGVLGATGITLSDWQFWVIFSSALGLYACGCILGKESQKNRNSNDKRTILLRKGARIWL